MNAQPTIALIVPVFNEENNIAPFVAEVERVLSDYLSQMVIVFVDDGSFDNTAQKIIELQQDKPLINLLQLSRNFGKEAAVSAALDTVEAAAYVIIDVDLQHPLSTVAEFIHIWQTEKINNIYGIRNEKHLSSIWFYRLFNKLSGRVKIPVNVSDFRLIDRKIVQILRTLPERNRFMKGLFAWSGLTSRGVPYVQAERKTGNTKFNYPKLWNFALDGIMGFSTLPLRVWSYFGGFVALLSFVYMLWIVAKTLIFDIDVPGYASLMSVILFLGGIQLVSIGILGEYLGRVSEEVKRRPVYVIDEIMGDIALNQQQNGCGVVIPQRSDNA